MPTPTISLQASNETPAGHRVTLIGVIGQNFTAHGQVSVSVHKAGLRQVVAHAYVTAGAGGDFDWGVAHQPRLGCDLELEARATDLVSGTEATDTTNVVCP